MIIGLKITPLSKISWWVSQHPQKIYEVTQNIPTTIHYANNWCWVWQWLHQIRNWILQRCKAHARNVISSMTRVSLLGGIFYEREAFKRGKFIRLTRMYCIRALVGAYIIQFLSFWVPKPSRDLHHEVLLNCGKFN